MTDQNNDLNQEEKDLLTEYESGELQSVSDLERRKKELKATVRDTLSKTRNINIRLTEKDLAGLKAIAVEEGLPYQTLVTSIIHKAVSNHPVGVPADSHMPAFVRGMSRTLEEDSNE